MNRRRRVRTSGERGKVTLELGSAGAQHLQILRDLSRRSEQARLPDPRRPFDDRRGALTPSRGGAQALELLELTLALHERRLYHLHTRHRTTAGSAVEASRCVACGGRAASPTPAGAPISIVPSR
jgi:hypothetical protein